MMLSGTAEMRSCKFCRSSSVLYAASAMRYAICARVRKMQASRKSTLSAQQIARCARPRAWYRSAHIPVRSPYRFGACSATLSVESQICLLMFHGDSSLLICCEGPCKNARQHNQA